jgi:hypothetical protein
LFGGVAVTVLYLLFAVQLAREPNALLLAAYLTSYGLYLAFLNGFPSLWLPNALLGSINTLHLVSLGLLFGFGAMFYRRYLLLASGYVWEDRVVAVLQWLGFAVMFSPMLPISVLGLIMALVTGVGPIFTSAIACCANWPSTAAAQRARPTWWRASEGRSLPSRWWRRRSQKRALSPSACGWRKCRMHWRAGRSP